MLSITPSTHHPLIQTQGSRFSDIDLLKNPKNIQENINKIIGMIQKLKGFEKNEFIKRKAKQHSLYLKMVKLEVTNFKVVYEILSLMDIKFFADTFKFAAKTFCKAAAAIDPAYAKDKAPTISTLFAEAAKKTFAQILANEANDDPEEESCFKSMRTTIEERTQDLEDALYVEIAGAEATKDIESAKQTVSLIQSKQSRYEALMRIVKEELKVNPKNAAQTVKTAIPPERNVYSYVGTSYIGSLSFEQCTPSQELGLSPVLIINQNYRARLEKFKVKVVMDLNAAIEQVNKYLDGSKYYYSAEQEEASNFNDLVFIEIIKVEAKNGKIEDAKTTVSLIKSPHLRLQAILEIIEVEVLKDLDAAKETVNKMLPLSLYPRGYYHAFSIIIKNESKLSAEKALSTFNSIMKPHSKKFEALYEKFRQIALFEIHKACIAKYLRDAEEKSREILKLGHKPTQKEIIEITRDLASAKKYIKNIQDQKIKEKLLIEIVKIEAIAMPKTAQKTTDKIARNTARQVKAYIEIVKQQRKSALLHKSAFG